ncbi:DUF4389 domain-containing protein [Phaeovulum sp.]|uniref:DUF4389 domain-containing protein n=1 Tax=Phaeovulum sp. TaxID=2934796 RepID=UPI003563D69F
MKTPKKPTDESPDPVVLENPAPEADEASESVEVSDDLPKNVWLHGLWMLIIAMLLRVVGALATLAAFMQFLWMLFGKKRNEGIKSFGEGMAAWMSKATLFLAGTSDEKPFPWTPWK